MTPSRSRSSRKRGRSSTISLCPASRAVTTIPLSSTVSPTLSSRIFASGIGISSRIMDSLPVLQRHLLAPAGPAHVGDGDVESGRMAVLPAREHAQHGRLPAEAHRPDAEPVEVGVQLLLERVERRVLVGGAQPAEELLLRQ